MVSGQISKSSVPPHEMELWGKMETVSQNARSSGFENAFTCDVGEVEFAGDAVFEFGPDAVLVAWFDCDGFDHLWRGFACLVGFLC